MYIYNVQVFSEKFSSLTDFGTSSSSPAMHEAMEAACDILEKVHCALWWSINVCAFVLELNRRQLSYEKKHILLILSGLSLLSVCAINLLYSAVHL